MTGKVAVLSERIDSLVSSETGRSVRAFVGKFVDGLFVRETVMLVSGETAADVAEKVVRRLGRDFEVFMLFEEDFLKLDPQERLSIHSESKAMKLFFA
jgi:hypothetical protein